MLGDGHVRFGGRAEETDQQQCRHRASARPNTYLRTWEGWLYLAAVQDAYSRRIVGWSMADHMRAELVVDALQTALHRRRPAPGLVHHSDQGSQTQRRRATTR